MLWSWGSRRLCFLTQTLHGVNRQYTNIQNLLALVSLANLNWRGGFRTAKAAPLGSQCSRCPISITVQSYWLVSAVRAPQMCGTCLRLCPNRSTCSRQAVLIPAWSIGRGGGGGETNPKPNTILSHTNRAQHMPPGLETCLEVIALTNLLTYLLSTYAY